MWVGVCFYGWRIDPLRSARDLIPFHRFELRDFQEEFGFGIAASLTFTLDAAFFFAVVELSFSLDGSNKELFPRLSVKDDDQEAPVGRFFRLSLKRHACRLCSILTVGQLFG